MDQDANLCIALKKILLWQIQHLIKTLSYTKKN